MSHTTDLLEELRWRGLLNQHTEHAAEALATPITAYCGFDPTAPSLHVGNLVPVMGLVHLQRAGHRPVALVGGGTGMIGDPSGKSAERTLQTRETVESNTRAIATQLARFLEFGGANAARMRDNADWLLGLGAVEFLRDVGKHFTVNYMTAKESVKARMESGISFTEFSYMLLQAYDVLELSRRDGVAMQIGGSDQWGNIVAGIELIRRSTGAEAHGVTLPLVTTAAGTKFGKTEAGAVWLDAERTSPYAFYQFWVNADDRDASRWLRFFTLKSREEVEALDRAIAERPESREAQQALALDVTARVHGEEAARTAVAVSRALFDRKADPREFSAHTLEAMRREIPSAAATPDDDGRLSVLDLLTATALVASKGEARRMLQQGGVTVNGRRLGAEASHVAASEALHGRFFLVRKGAREMGLVEIAKGA
jgi:tyrosyl-tRNA synthetase